MTSHILIVDPVATNRIVLKARLSTALYKVDVASSISDAMYRMSQSHYETVFIAGDWDVDTSPEISPSLALLERCKADPERHITVICMQDPVAPDNDTAWERRCLALGADDCLIRPVPSEVLLARLRNLMRGSAQRVDLPHAYTVENVLA